MSILYVSYFVTVRTCPFKQNLLPSYHWFHMGFPDTINFANFADYMFCNEHVNFLITYSFDFHNEELLSYYISFLRLVVHTDIFICIHNFFKIFFGRCDCVTMCMQLTNDCFEKYFSSLCKGNKWKVEQEYNFTAC